MACHIIKDKKLGTVFLCGCKMLADKLCRKCNAIADKLCDYPVGNEKTCDAPLCGEHAINITGDIDYCPDHAKEHLGWKNKKLLMQRKRSKSRWEIV